MPPVKTKEENLSLNLKENRTGIQSAGQSMEDPGNRTQRVQILAPIANPSRNAAK